MKRKRKTFFLPIILASSLLFAACDNVTPEPPEPVVTTFTVSFDANGGTGSMADVTGLDGEYTLPECSFIAPTGKHFAGWKVNNQGELLQPGAKIYVSMNTQIVAIWEITTYTVSFDANGGTGTMASVTNVVGEYTLPESTFTAPTGHYYGGWKVNGEGDVLQPGAKINVETDVRVVAEWTPHVYNVTFKNGDTVLDTVQVAYGTKAEYTGATPTKAVDGDGFDCYRFRGWNEDINAPITGDTVFTAKFGKYNREVKVEDFEKYELAADMIDEGWEALGYSNATGKWTNETKASVSLGKRAGDGKQSLKFEAWENGVGYKFKKSFKTNEFKDVNAVNALQYKLMLPSINTVKVLLYANAPITDASTQQTTIMEVQFNYTYKPTSSEYVEYTIPLNDSNWLAWGNAQYGTLHTIAEAAGMSEDDILKTITKIEFYIEGNDGIGGQPYIAFFDSLKFVTLDDPKRNEVEEMGQYTTYTGIAASGNTIKLELGAQGAAKATVLDAQVEPIDGSIAISGKEVTFTSNDQGATLIYKGTLVDGGQSIKGISAEGSLKTTVGEMDLSAVQVVDNFDQYTSEGKTWYITIDQQTKEVTEHKDRSGCRGAYYAEYYAGERSAEFGGGGWSLMQGGEQMKLKTDGGHSGNNYLCLKSSLGNAMRYMQFGLIDGTSECNSFRGSKFSFWAKTKDRVPVFKVYMYSQTTPRNASKDNYVKVAEFKEDAAIGEWKHFEIELNPKVVYYGYCIMMENHYKYDSCPDSYLYIDDVEVYTVSPYVTQVR